MKPAFATRPSCERKAAWAASYSRLVDAGDAAEARANPGKYALSIMGERKCAKLMSYKDEYEVARLHADPAFRQQLKDAFEDGAQLRYNLAPPLFSKRDPQTGHLLKREFGPWMGKAFALLARFMGLRGPAVDIFSFNEERKMERALIGHSKSEDYT